MRVKVLKTIWRGTLAVRSGLNAFPETLVPDIQLSFLNNDLPLVCVKAQFNFSLFPIPLGRPLVECER